MTTYTAPPRAGAQPMQGNTAQVRAELANRFQAILGLPDAAGLQQLAQHLAFSTELGVDEAAAILSLAKASAKSSGGHTDFREAMNRLKNPVLNLLSRPLSWVLRTTSFVLVRTVGHRTMTHSVFGVLLFSLLVLLFLGRFPNLALALVAGYASHVFADALNTRGVPLLWPVGKPFRLLPGGVRSGGAVEVAVALVALAFTLYALLLLYPELRGAISLQPI